jgi:hypothetical protein
LVFDKKPIGVIPIGLGKIIVIVFGNYGQFFSVHSVFVLCKNNGTHKEKENKGEGWLLHALQV